MIFIIITFIFYFVNILFGIFNKTSYDKIIIKAIIFTERVEITQEIEMLKEMIEMHPSITPMIWRRVNLSLKISVPIIICPDIAITV